jgi:hypothetical protein
MLPIIKERTPPETVWAHRRGLVDRGGAEGVEPGVVVDKYRHPLVASWQFLSLSPTKTRHDHRI